MKKLSLALLLVAFFALNSFAQNHIAVQAVPLFAPNDDWSTNSVEFNAQYVRDIGNIFHVGVGSGIGTATPVRYYSQWDIDHGSTTKTDLTQKTLFVPVFVRGKVDFGTKPSHGFFAVKAGTKIAFVEGFDGKDFNPFIANIAPSIGYDFKLGKHKLGIEFVVDAVFGRYQEINFSYDELLKDYRYENFEKKTDSFWAAFGVAITFEF